MNHLSSEPSLDEDRCCKSGMSACILLTIETVGGTSVSSDSRGEDGCCELAGEVHFHVASPAQNNQSCRGPRLRGFFVLRSDTDE